TPAVTNRCIRKTIPGSAPLKNSGGTLGHPIADKKIILLWTFVGLEFKKRSTLFIRSAFAKVMSKGS
ncbi:MAG: hypothetical protein WBV91_08820, partial [Desulfobacterales bacterium]